MKHIITTIIALTAIACTNTKPVKEPANYVNTFIGTAEHGHTYPGATTPFGMVQLSPDTGIEGWDWCSGYHDSDSSVMGFSHTHLSGTGGADLGDILFMPTNGNLILVPGTKESPDDGYRSRFSHASEKSEPGYYSVKLEDFGTLVELTATPRTGIHRYAFDGTKPQFVVIDLNHGIADQTREGYFRVVDSVTIEGYRRSRGWADDHTVYFRARFSHPFNAVESSIDGVPYNEKSGNGTKVALAAIYDNPMDTLEIQVAISVTSLAGAAANLEAERSTFDQARSKAFSEWNRELSKIKIETNSEEDKTIFYTALYHTMIAPTLVSDVDGAYLGADAKVYKDKSITAYGLFSLWDTFRSLHPLFTIIKPSLNQEFIRSIIRYYEHTGRLPVWDLNMNETNCMIGYHAIPVIADAYMKGQRDFDADKALEAMVASAMQSDWNGVQYVQELGYIPSDREPNSVSKALEIAYDDWCIAQMAKAMGRDSIYQVFNRRAQYYKNHFDTQDKFFKGRNAAGELTKEFDPTAVSLWGSGDFTEGNAWQYCFFVPQDVNTHIEMVGGDKAYIAKLDQMFDTEGVQGHVSDVTGLIGQYAQGNEPSHHVAYLYSFAGAPWKTQERVAAIMNSDLFTCERGGICGNEDCGQMSAWYVMSSMGFYSVTPASGIYVFGTPSFKKVTIDLENGKQFVVKAENFAPESIYIKEVFYNGESYNKSYITHDMIKEGGELRFVMANAPKKSFATGVAERPVSVIDQGVVSGEQMLAEVVFEPSFEEKRRVFSEKLTVYPVASNKVYYSLNGNEPYLLVGEKGVDLTSNCTLKLIAKGENGRRSGVVSERFYRTVLPSGSVVIGTEPSEPYVANGMASLTDGLMGGDSYKNKQWVGFEGKDVELTITLPKSKFVGSVSVNCFNRPNDWILPPQSVEVLADGGVVRKVRTAMRDYQGDGARMYTIAINRNCKSITLRLEGGLLPDWHVNGGNKQWIFVDELILN